MWRPSSFGYSFSSQIRKLPPLLLLFSAKLSSCTHYVRTSLYLPRFGSAQPRSPSLSYPKFDVPLSRALSLFLGRHFPLPQKRPPAFGLFTSLSRQFPPPPSRGQTQLSPSSALCLFVTVIANFETGRLGRNGGKSGEVGRNCP